MSTSAINSSTPSTTSSTPSSSSGGWASLQPSDFIQMMVTQLQNQDPTQPTSNEEILQQISQIGQLQASDTLQTNLQAMVLQNSISSAGNLIGKTVKGVDQTGDTSSGTVNSVNVQNGSVLLQLDSGQQMLLSNVQDISQASSSGTTGSGSTTGASTTGASTAGTSSTSAN